MSKAGLECIKIAKANGSWSILDEVEELIIPKDLKFALENNIEVQLHYLDIPKEIRWQRVQNRNQEKGITFEFEVSENDFNFMETWFEQPTNQELNEAIIISS